jgi:dGTPase
MSEPIHRETHGHDPELELLCAAVFAREQALLAPYAMPSAASAGRKHPERPHRYRAPFQRDRDRILHSAAYRRLSYKTQVFTGELGDYHRTRLTHTLEVASVARNLGRALRLNEDLIEALALAHDLGHPPFGHAGEDALDECLAAEGGFSHNRQGLRIVEEIEQRYPDFPGLNLSLEVLEGQAARIHKGPLAEGRPGDSASGQPLLEVQVVEAADSVAYDTHDADDALQLGLLRLDELLEVPLWREAAARVRRRFSAVRGRELERAILHELIDWQVGDLLTQTFRRLRGARIESPGDVRQAGPLVRPCDELAELKLELERMLHERVYRHPQVLAMRVEAQSFLREMFARYLDHPELLPQSFLSRAPRLGLPRTVGDYLAGMTDRYAQQMHARLRSALPHEG